MRFRIGSFNMMDLVLPGVPFYNRDPYSQHEYEQKLDWIAGQLHRMEAQIVGFQEVFHEEALKQACGQLDIYKHGTVIAPLSDGTRPRVGLATSLDLVGKPETFKHFPDELDLSYEGKAIPIDRFSRPVLKVKVQLTKKQNATIFVAHLKSKRPIVHGDRNDPRQVALGEARALLIRSLEAAALRSLVVDEIENNKQPVILMGDLNDSVNAVTTRTITGMAPFRSMPPNQKQAMWDVLLYSTYDIQARQSLRDVNYSHIFNGNYEALDHILVSQEFYRYNPKRIGEVEMLQFYNDHIVDETLTDEPRGRIESDHGQVVATIRMRH